MKYTLSLFLFLFTLKTFAGFLPTTFKAEFIQTYESSLSKKIKKTQGNIFYKYPGHLYFEVKGDVPVTYVSNNKKSWVYNPPFVEGEKGTLREALSSRHSFSKFFDALSKGLKNNDLYDVSFKEKTVLIKFKPEVAKQITLLSALLYFDKKAHENMMMNEIQKIELQYLSKKPKVTLSFENYKENVELREDLFSFKVPSNTEVIKED